MDKLYLTIHEAAEYVGIGRNAMYDYVNSSDPPPFLRVGNRRLLQKAALEDYFENLQEVKR